MAAIVNHRGQPMRAERPLFDTEIATTHDGRDITRGWISEQHYLRPQDKVLLYQGAGNYEVYEDMLRDDRIHSALSQRRAAVVARETEVLPGGTMRRDRLAADFLRETLDHVRWDTVTDRMLYGVYYGYSVAEALYARDGAHVMLDQIRVRNRRRFVFDANFEPCLLTTNNATGEPLPPRKFWTFATGADNDDEPYGRGLAHYLYWPCWFKKNQVKFWLIFLEKFGTPTATGKYPPSASETERRQLLQALRAIHVDSAVSLPESMQLELLEAKRGGTVDYAAFYQQMQNAITTIILSQTMTTEDGSSQSQAEVHMDVRRELVEADAYLICDSFNRQLGAWLTEWNFPGAAKPKVRRQMTNPAGLKTLAERDRVIFDMGHRLTADYIEKTYSVEVDRDAPAPQREPDDVRFAEADDPVAALAAMTRSALGPKFDSWLPRLRAGLDTTASLPAFAAWLDHGIEVLAIGAIADELGLALVAATLAGRYDVAEAPVELAEQPSLEHVRLPFAQQIAFFRDKLSLPTRYWTDIWQAQHDVAFVVAGAARDELLSDLRDAVDSAIAEGTTLATFRQRFDAIVAKHGWSYRGGRDWRTRVIFETNLRTSYAAGRWQQLQVVKERMPYWRYRHSHASEHPREMHLAWHGLVLHADDPWWHTHYPPNGWGCKCSVEALSASDLRGLGKSGPDSAPGLNRRPVRIGQGPDTRAVDVPEGIDPGFAYAPGRAATLGDAMRHRLRQSLPQPPTIAAAGIADILAHPRTLTAFAEQWHQWHRQAVATGRQVGAFEIGALTPPIIATLHGQRRATLDSAAITIAQSELIHMTRPAKIARDAALDAADLDRLPFILANPEAVLLDTARPGELLYVFTPTDASAHKGKKGKVVIRVNYTEKLQIGDRPRQTVISNSIRTAGYVAIGNLRERRYEVLEGRLE